ncbi:MAG: hypothetical protein J5918_07240 [Prevotella sp.]|nr:hypothetical protein [Prevotella sp.]
MKKADFLLTRSCLLILSVIVLFGFVSCGDDDIDKNNPTPPMSMINKSYDVTYTVKVTDPKVLSDIADLEIQYFDPEGELHIDTINSDNWSKKYFFEQHLGSKIGLKARWLFHDKAQLDKLVERENEKPADQRNTYNFSIDITSPYIATKTDDTKIESMFKSKREIGITNRSYTAAAIVEGLIRNNLQTEFYWEVISKQNDFLIMQEGAFPLCNIAYDVTYSVKIADRKVISDLADLEISYYNDKGEFHRQVLTDYHLYQDTYYFRAIGAKIGLRARWLFRDKSVLDAVVENENKKSEKDRNKYDFSLDITSPCVIITSGGTTNEDKLTSTNSEGINGMTYTAEEVVSKLLSQKLYTELFYSLYKENNDMKLNAEGKLDQPLN